MTATLDASSDWAIDLHDVQKVYNRKVHALRGIEMRVRRGEVFGLLGPNGAGKSTLVKILMTVISPTKAAGTVLGQGVGHKPTLARIGYLPEHHKFPEYLTGAQVVDLYAALAGVERTVRRMRTPELLELVGMREWATTKISGYSKGMRQRVGIAQALACDPDLVVLDEPTDGVDPVGRRDIREMLTRIKDRGKTVFLNSHLLSELEMVCDRVAILVQGKVASQGTIDELTIKRQAYELEVAALGAGEDAGAIAGLLRAAPAGALLPGPVDAASNEAGPLARRVGYRGELPTGEALEVSATPSVEGVPSGAMLRVFTADAARVQPVIDALRARSYVLKSVRLIRPSLEDLFMEAVTDPTTGQAKKPGAAR